MMRDIIEIASALKRIYESVFICDGEESDLTEMKMHKLLYFAQKKHFENFGEWLFSEDFEGWVHGPVNLRVRSLFPFIDGDEVELTPEEEYTIREVVFDFGRFSAYDLSDLSHKEKAYQISREGLRGDERGSKIILKENMLLDINQSDEDLIADIEVH